VGRCTADAGEIEALLAEGPEAEIEVGVIDAGAFISYRPPR
jgi:hypothetical protein